MCFYLVSILNGVTFVPPLKFIAKSFNKRLFYIPTRIALVLLRNIAESVLHRALLVYSSLSSFCKFITSFDSITPLAEEVICFS
jgi:hypothetical protein